MTKNKTVTVFELVAALQTRALTDKVRVWLPGSTIALGSVFSTKPGTVLIEGNVDPDAALAQGGDSRFTHSTDAPGGVEVKLAPRGGDPLNDIALIVTEAEIEEIDALRREGESRLDFIRRALRVLRSATE